jgi:hypothetical protein
MPSPLLQTRPHRADLVLCDRCGAPGATRAVLLSGLDLVLCGHHAREHGPELVAAGASLTTHIKIN